MATRAEDPKASLKLNREVIHRIPWAPGREVHITKISPVSGQQPLGEHFEIVDYVLIDPLEDTWRYGQGIVLPARQAEAFQEGAAKLAGAFE